MTHIHKNGHDLSEPGAVSETPGLTDISEPELPAPQSFILKIWLVQDSTGAPPGWHGRVTHVPSGRHIYVRSLPKIIWFIAEYLDAMGGRLPLIWQLYRWLDQFR